MTALKELWCALFHSKYLKHEFSAGEMSNYKCSKCGTWWTSWSGGQG